MKWKQCGEKFFTEKLPNKNKIDWISISWRRMILNLIKPKITKEKKEKSTFPLKYPKYPFLFPFAIKTIIWIWKCRKFLVARMFWGEISCHSRLWTIRAAWTSSFYDYSSIIHYLELNWMPRVLSSHCTIHRRILNIQHFFKLFVMKFLWSHPLRYR